MTTTVQTVRGPVAAADLGRVLVHEHLASLVPGPWLAGGRRERLADPGALRVAPDDELAADDQVRAAVGALSGLADLGYGTVVDLSPYGVVGREERGANAGLLARIAQESGLHVVAGTASYLEAFTPAWTREATLDELTERFVADVETGIGGIGGTGVRAGVLGEQATGLGEIRPSEEVALRAAARAHVRTGVALVTHTTHATMALEQLDILRQEGADLSRVAIGHMDIRPDLDYVLRVLDSGASVAFDTIGKQHWDFFLEPPPAQPDEGEHAKRAYFRPDLGRARRLVELVERGYADQILLSHDLTGAEVYLNPRTHGQWGFAYLDRVFLPMAIELGLPAAVADRLVRDNPQRLLAVREA